ncbi:MAG: DinB family protein [Chloroflexi bacterium]|nr:DinB family protein [Chloroflexota bacterium]
MTRPFQEIIRLLPDEEFEFALDARGGLATQPVALQEGLVLTNARVVWVGRKKGRQATLMAPLHRVEAVEMSGMDRNPQRLGQGLVLLGGGLLLAFLIWVVLEVPPLALILGGIPAVVGVYLLLEYLLGEEQGELTVHAGSQSLRLVLISSQSAVGAYTLAQRLLELLTGSSAAQVAEPPSPQPHPEHTELSPERRELLSKLEAERGRLMELVRNVDDDTATRTPQQGEWSVKQNLAHVAEVEREMVAEARRGCHGDTPEVGFAGEGQYSITQERANSRPLADLLLDLDLARQRTAQATQDMGEGELQHRVRHRRFGELSVLQLLRAVYRHDRMHADQVEQALKALTPRQQG